jgi:hypothetical protein
MRGMDWLALLSFAISIGIILEPGMAIWTGENQSVSAGSKSLGAPRIKGDGLWPRNLELLNNYPT